MSDGNDSVFNISQFLEEYGTDFDPKVDLLQMKISAGFGVFAGRESKFFESKSNEKSVAEAARNEARKYAETLGKKPKVYPAVEQVWYTPILNKDRQPNWPDGEWREMKRRTVVQVNGGDWEETGDWIVFSRQWADDNPAIKPQHFGQKLWVLAGYVSHPDFDPNAPDKYTSYLGDDGEYHPRYIRVVSQVIGDRAAADAWLAANGGDSKDSNSEHDEALEKELIEIYNRMPILQRKQYSGVAEWLPNAKEILSILQQGGDTSDWVSSGLVTKNAIDEIDALAKAHPPF